MKAIKQLGIWMDHSIANLIESQNDKMVRSTLNLTPAFLGPLENLRLNESLIQNKEQNQQSDFYKKLSNIINDYNEVLLFGPTDAKTELFNLLKDNRQFEKIKITVQSTDNMTVNQQETFVKDFYGNQTETIEK